MRIPDPGPLGETFFDASVRAMVAALRLNSPSGGWVESVVTPADHRLGFALVRFVLIRFALFFPLFVVFPAGMSSHLQVR